MVRGPGSSVEVLGPWSGPRSSVAMVVHIHKLLTLGVGLGSIWVCDEYGAANTAEVGCAINCMEEPIAYQTGVKPFWLHISYHGELGHTTWQRRVLGAMRLVLKTLVEGENVAVHCRHGTQMEKWYVVADASASSDLKLRVCPQSRVHRKLSICPQSQVHGASAHIYLFSQANIGLVFSSSCCSYS